MLPGNGRRAREGYHRAWGHGCGGAFILARQADQRPFFTGDAGGGGGAGRRGSTGALHGGRGGCGSARGPTGRSGGAVGVRSAGFVRRTMSEAHVSSWMLAASRVSRHGATGAPAGRAGGVALGDGGAMAGRPAGAGVAGDGIALDGIAVDGGTRGAGPASR